MALREIFASFGFQIDTAALDAADKKTDEFADKLKSLGTLLIGGVILNGVKNFVSGLAEQGQELKNNATKLGASTEELQRWQFAAEQSGVSADQLNNAFKFLQKNAFAASEGGKAQTKAFKELGVEVKDASGEILPTTQIMHDVATAIANTKSPAERTALALKLLGRGGQALVPMFAQGGKALDDLLESLDEFGGGLSEEAIDSMVKVRKAGVQLDMAFTSLKGVLAVALFPTIAKAVSWFGHFVVVLKESSEKSKIFEAALVVLGIVGAAAGLTALAPWLPFIALLAIAILLVDDLWSALDGGDSAIGRLLDRIFGPGAGESIFKQINKDLDDFSAKTANMGAWDTIKEGLSEVGASLTKFIVDDLPDLWHFIGPGIVGAFSDAWEAVKGVFKDAWEWWNNLSHNIIQGIVDGIKAGTGAVVDAFKALGDAMKGAFGTDWKINSPSGYMIEQMKHITDGGVIGLKRGEGDVQSAFTSVFSPDMNVPQAQAVSRSASIKSQGSYQIFVNASGSVADAARDGVTMAHNDDRRATFEELESVA